MVGAEIRLGIGVIAVKIDNAIEYAMLRDAEDRQQAQSPRNPIMGAPHEHPRRALEEHPWAERASLPVIDVAREDVRRAAVVGRIDRLAGPQRHADTRVREQISIEARVLLPGPFGPKPGRRHR